MFISRLRTSTVTRASGPCVRFEHSRSDGFPYSHERRTGRRPVSRWSCFALILSSFVGLLPAIVQAADPAPPTTMPSPTEPRLSFQTGAPWSPRINLNADIAMVYGVDATLPQRIDSWKQHGYTINVMTGVAWGEYQDYLFGRFDGINHEDEAQTERSGAKIGHGKDVYYMCPGPTYGKYLCTLAKKAIDAGAQSLYLEEPEFWVRSGYEPRFKEEWKAYYGEEWRDPQSSPDAQYRASKLKYFLYRRALSDVFKFVRDYGKSRGQDIRCYVATHSLLNYASWGIVSPESSLLDVGCDGYIAQVWTGTSRTPNACDGVEKQRTFETAFLEYGQMQNLVRASGRDMWFLNDPVEDNARHTWDDYRYNWESTLTASLLQPDVWRYEIMPWPERVFNGKYPSRSGDPKTVPHVGISQDYQTELQAVIRALGEMKQPPDAVRWEQRGTAGVGVLVSDTLMFQRIGPHASDGQLASFYGLAMPLVNHGIPVEPVQLEDADQSGFLSHYKLLLLTYEGQKPPRPQLHAALAQWVRDGGALVVVDADTDPYNAVTEWWNTGDLHDATPRIDLFRQLGVSPQTAGVKQVGRGVVLYTPTSPAALAHTKGGSQQILGWCADAAKAIGVDWQESPALVLRRGPYVIAASVDGPSDQPPVILTGRFIPLFDPALPVVSSVTLKPAHRQLLVDLDALDQSRPTIAAASCRVDQQVQDEHALSFNCTGIADTTAALRILCPTAPKSVKVGDSILPQERWIYRDKVLQLEFPNQIEPTAVRIEF
jgi:hypothetical protein